jgi:hypothetical protein
MNATDLYAAVRAELGRLESANTVDILDSDILRESTWIISRIAERIPVKTLRSFTSQAYVREYPVADETLRVKEVISSGAFDEWKFTLGTVTLFNPGIGSGLFVSNMVESDDLYEHPSMQVIRLQKLRKAWPKISFSFNPISRLLTLDPTPTVSGVTVWYNSVEKNQWSLDKVPSDFEELVVTGTTWKCLNIVFLRRSNSGGIMRSGGQVDYPSHYLQPYVTAKQKDFDEELVDKARIYSFGA